MSKVLEFYKRQSQLECQRSGYIIGRTYTLLIQVLPNSAAWMLLLMVQRGVKLIFRYEVPIKQQLTKMLLWQRHLIGQDFF